MSMATAPLPDVPLADLHRHLDGSLRRSALRHLAAEAGVAVDPDLRFRPAMGLEAALACFAATLAVLQRPDAVRRVAHEICLDATSEGVSTLEIRFAPQLHRGGAVEDIVDATLEGINGRAGLILCGLYGEDPRVLEGLVDLAGSRPGVVGIDLAGGPAPGHRWGIEDYAAAFTRARDLGLGRTVHAGEGRPATEIRVAVERLHAQRIGHGTTVLEDASVVRLLIEQGIVLEACVTSNVHTGVISASEEHPLVRWLDAGLAVCVNTDNTLLSSVDARSELAVVAGVPGMDEARLRRLIGHGHAAAFRRAA